MFEIFFSPARKPNGAVWLARIRSRAERIRLARERIRLARARGFFCPIKIHDCFKSWIFVFGKGDHFLSVYCIDTP